MFDRIVAGIETSKRHGTQYRHQSLFSRVCAGRASGTSMTSGAISPLNRALLHGGSPRGAQRRRPAPGCPHPRVDGLSGRARGAPRGSRHTRRYRSGRRRGRETASLLTALYSRQAYALATLRDSSGCAAAISKTRTHVERLNRDEDPPYLYWVGRAEVTAGAGRCLLKLGKADQAAAMLEEGITLFDESFVRDRRNYLIRLAEASAHPCRSAIWMPLPGAAWRHSICPRAWIQPAASAVFATSTAR